MKKNEFLQLLDRLLMDLPYEERRAIMKDYEEQFQILSNEGQEEEYIVHNFGSPSDISRRYISSLPLQSSLSLDVSDSTISSETSQMPFISSPFCQASNSLNVPSEMGLPNNSAKQTVHTQGAFPPNNQSTISYSKKGIRNPLRSLLLFVTLGFMNLTFVLGPFIAFWTLAFSGAVVGVALFVSGIVVIISSLVTSPLAFVSMPVGFLAHPVLIFATGLGLTGFGGLILVITFFFIKFLAVCTSKYAKWNFDVIRG